MINEKAGWHLNAKDVANFLNKPFFDVMEMPTLEVFGIMVLINYEGKLKQLYNSNGTKA